MEKISTSEIVDASVIRGAGSVESIGLIGRYNVQCYDSDGNMKWEDNIDNLVTTVGKDDLLDKYLSGSSYTAAFYFGLIDNSGFLQIVVGDTMASHAGWSEYTNYSSATRPAPTFASASSGSKSTSGAVSFTASGAGGTVTGAFLVTNSTKGGSSGVLVSAGQFTGGNKTVVAGDIVNVTYTLSA